MIQRSSETSGRSLSSSAKLFRTGSSLSSRVICTWRVSSLRGTKWSVFSSFFGAYLTVWGGQGILNEAWKHKLIFVETPDATETSVALENYRRVSISRHYL